VAVHLAEAGVKTLALDKRDIGTGSTSASTGLLQYEIAMATQFGWIFSQRGCQGNPGDAIRQV
jgi:glycine/D-amino acid oxidase-like deaminating enzyme